ncbi:MAG: BrxE family protein [bacterium]|nr:BrxE family protein [bacterium]
MVICYIWRLMNGIAMTEGGLATRVGGVVRLVLGVARLGEADLRGWWSCHGLDRVGSYVLSRALPRTWRSAGLELDVLSAQRRHDDALAGRASALHLFSDELPLRRWAAAWLAEQKTADAADELFAELEGWNDDAASRRLSEWAGEPEPGEALGDGLLLGRVVTPDSGDEAALAALARRLAAAYLGLDGTFRAPYFDSEA